MTKGVAPSDEYAFGPYRLSPGEFRLTRDGQPVPLTDKMYQLLLVLVQAPGRLRTREELIDQLWPSAVVEEQNLTWTVSQLRRVLDDESAAPVYIETVRGKGYRFIAPIRVVVADEAVTAAVVERAEPTPAGSPARQGWRWFPVAVALLAAVLIAAGVAWWSRSDPNARTTQPYRLAIRPTPISRSASTTPSRPGLPASAP